VASSFAGTTYLDATSLAILATAAWFSLTFLLADSDRMTRSLFYSHSIPF
jgi:hypothetical protein